MIHGNMNLETHSNSVLISGEVVLMLAFSAAEAIAQSNITPNPAERASTGYSHHRRAESHQFYPWEFKYH
jgi:hypothetical protein